MNQIDQVKSSVGIGNLAATMLGKIEEQLSILEHTPENKETITFLTGEHEKWRAQLKKSQGNASLTNMIIAMDCEKAGLTGVEKSILTCLSFYCSNDQISHVTMNKVAEKTGFASSSVKRGIKALNEKGLIKTIKSRSCRTMPNSYDMSLLISKWVAA